MEPDLSTGMENTSMSDNESSPVDSDVGLDSSCLHPNSEETEVWEDLGKDDEWFLEEDCVATSETTTTASALVVWLVNLIAHIQRKHYVPDTTVGLLLKVYLFSSLSWVDFIPSFWILPSLFQPQYILYRNF